mmetsp:Transcript_100072/g.172732  ORF Transcript_100072/g.172732 Transcript_100072/m.172732 type:complete len:240 (-) Transcript_100072:1279-1998(-)
MHQQVLKHERVEGCTQGLEDGAEMLVIDAIVCPCDDLGKLPDEVLGLGYDVRCRGCSHQEQVTEDVIVEPGLVCEPFPCLADCEDSVHHIQEPLQELWLVVVQEVLVHTRPQDEGDLLSGKVVCGSFEQMVEDDNNACPGVCIGGREPRWETFVGVVPTRQNHICRGGFLHLPLIVGGHDQRDVMVRGNKPPKQLDSVEHLLTQDFVIILGTLVQGVKDALQMLHCVVLCVADGGLETP